MPYLKDTMLCGQTWADLGFGLVRAENGKYTWLLNPGNCNSAILLYDFSLNTGDTTSSFDIGQMVVDQTDMVTLNDGLARKRLKLKSINPQNPWAEQTWIDGIGEANRDFFRNSDWEGGYGQVICVRDNSGLIYQNPARILDCDSLLCPVPRPDFSFVCEGKTFNFKNESTHSDQFFWDFGDGETSTEINPEHTYTSPGCYKVIITAKSNCLPQEYINYQTINVDALNYWAPVAGAASLSFGKIQFLDSQHGWGIAYPNQIWKTSDGGATWTNVDYPGPDRQLGDIQFKNFNQGIIAVNNLDTLPGNILWTDDGTTFKLSQVTGVFGSINAVERLNDVSAVISSQYQDIFITKDGGNTWVQKNIPGAVSLIEDFEQTENGTLHFYGINLLVPNTEYRIAGKSSDMGETWGFRTIPDHYAHGTIRFLNNEEGWIGGFSGLFHTTDGGDTWNKLTNAKFSCNRFSFYDALHGWAGGYNSGIYYTNDGGQSWTQQACIYRDRWIFGINAFNDTVAYASAGGSLNRFSTQPYLEVTCGTSSTDINSGDQLSATFAPNPVHAQALFTWKSAAVSTSTLTLYNLNGQIMREERLNGNDGNTMISVAGFPPGMYFWKWMAGSGEIVSGKIVVQH